MLMSGRKALKQTIALRDVEGLQDLEEPGGANSC
jgi:hypothetical protein